MTLETAYLPSANKAIRDGCPDRLAVVATLFGLDPAPPERCRVLEIGCAEGAHLAPLALFAPESSFVGVDLEPRAIARGNETIAAVGLANLSLECADFRELSGRSERFDYVVAHGMYSWLGRDARDALLATIAALLSERGVAYVSFNDYIAEHNESVTLGAFAEHLERHGLAYVTDAGTLDRSPFAEHELVKALEASASSAIEPLEVADRLEMRRFRQAVVRRGTKAGPIDFERAESLWLASSAEPAARGSVRESGPVRFKMVSGLELETNVAPVKLALYELGRVWPAALGLGDLAERVGERLEATTTSGELSRTLLGSGASAAVRAFFRAPRARRTPSTKPEASSLARLEALRGGDVTNLHHEPVKMDVPFHRSLLGLLDGSRDREALARSLADEIETGTLVVSGVERGARARWEGLIGREVDAGLERLARYALLFR